MFDSREFAAMKTNAVFVNIGRGSLVDHHALAGALQRGEIGSAGLDVTEPEPLPRDHPLLSLDNVIITPHRGSATMKCRMRMIHTAVKNIQAALNDEPMPSEITS
ncbi:Glyoxylate reductase/hydroxypyruvate reductase [Geodia barretti]|uniref:Glyoxylate reductase/hydroxypyruvate reductase n=2 Tax=Geodia barretti TaxID=519541 RepID=A0AA35RKZ9_GEOBA|nr:Glyoxylate reductase/hydroxypyruvate reductase [Geodia barretti]